jgi:hypothetical protein
LGYRIYLLGRDLLDEDDFEVDIENEISNIKVSIRRLQVQIILLLLLLVLRLICLLLHHMQTGFGILKLLMFLYMGKKNNRVSIERRSLLTIVIEHQVAELQKILFENKAIVESGRRLLFLYYITDKIWRKNSTVSFYFTDSSHYGYVIDSTRHIKAFGPVAAELRLFCLADNAVDHRM